MADKPHVALAAAACVVPQGDSTAPTAALWELLLTGAPQFQRRPHLGVDLPLCTLPQQAPARHATVLAADVLRRVRPALDAGPERAGLFVATTKGELEPWLQSGASEPLGELLAGLDTELPGLPAFRRVVSNACVSGAQAVMDAAEMLQEGQLDQALVLGVDGLTGFVAQGFASLQGASALGARPFDATRDGLTLGEAAAALVLRRAADCPLASPRLGGWGGSNDANHISGPSRDGGGLALAIRRALADAGLAPAAVRAICAHGTATRYNDAMEARAFHAVFGHQPPPVFGVKGSVGHTLGAAGLMEVVLSARVAQTGIIPPTAGYTQGESDFALDVVHGEARSSQPGPVLTTNSGFGGMNTAIVLLP